MVRRSRLAAPLPGDRGGLPSGNRPRGGHVTCPGRFLRDGAAPCVHCPSRGGGRGEREAERRGKREPGMTPGEADATVMDGAGYARRQRCPVAAREL